MVGHRFWQTVIAIIALVIGAQHLSASEQTTTGGYPGSIPCFGFTGDIPIRIEVGVEIRYVVPGGGETVLSVYDIEGHVVARLVDSAALVGVQAVRWSGLDKDDKPFSNGVYFIRLEAGGYTDYRKVVVIQ